MTADEQLKRWMEHLSVPFRDLDRTDQIKLLQTVGVMKYVLGFYADENNQIRACIPPTRGWVPASSRAVEALASVEQALGGGKE